MGNERTLARCENAAHQSFAARKKGHLTFLAYFPRTDTFARLRSASASTRNAGRPPASSGRPSADTHPPAPGGRYHATRRARTRPRSSREGSLARPCFRRVARYTAPNLPRYYRWRDRLVYASCCWMCAVPPLPSCASVWQGRVVSRRAFRLGCTRGGPPSFAVTGNSLSN